jgi:hypothetical protein
MGLRDNRTLILLLLRSHDHRAHHQPDDPSPAPPPFPHDQCSVTPVSTFNFQLSHYRLTAKFHLQIQPLSSPDIANEIQYRLNTKACPGDTRINVARSEDRGIGVRKGGSVAEFVGKC